jgi:hypothetical protein
VTEQAGRYQRSFGGLIGAMVVILLAIGAFVAFRAVNRDVPDGGPDPIDYLEQVGYAQEADLTVVYPSSLPEGWYATSVTLGQETPPAWGIGMLTDSGSFVGIRQEQDDVEDLLATYVDEEHVDEAPAITVEGSIAPEWQGWTDQGGDRAYAAEVDGETVLVYGSASEADLRTVVERLTTEPVPND